MRSGVFPRRYMLHVLAAMLSLSPPPPPPFLFLSPFNGDTPMITVPLLLYLRTKTVNAVINAYRIRSFRSKACSSIWYVESGSTFSLQHGRRFFDRSWLKCCMNGLFHAFKKIKHVIRKIKRIPVLVPVVSFLIDDCLLYSESE